MSPPTLRNPDVDPDYHRWLARRLIDDEAEETGSDEDWPDEEDVFSPEEYLAPGDVFVGRDDDEDEYEGNNEDEEDDGIEDDDDEIVDDNDGSWLYHYAYEPVDVLLEVFGSDLEPDWEEMPEFED